MGNRANFAVDADSRDITKWVEERELPSTEPDGDPRKIDAGYVKITSIDDLGQNTSNFEYSQFIWAIFVHDWRNTITFLIPFLALASAVVGLWYWQNGDTLMLPVLVLPFLIVYRILTKMYMHKVVLIHKDEQSGEVYFREDEFWNADVDEFPQECMRYDRTNDEWIPWIDMRNGIKAYNPWESEQLFDEQHINASDVMGTEAYLKTTYNIGNMKAESNFFERFAPSGLLIIGAVAAIWIGSDRIMAMMNLQ